MLVPVMMERELMRKYSVRAKDAAKKFEKAVSKHPVSSLELGELKSRAELEEQCYVVLQQQWETFKEHFIVEDLPLVGNLEEVVKWYFADILPFASSRGKQKEFPDAFILSALDQYHKQHNASIAVVTDDQGFGEACQPRPYINHYSELAEYIKSFQPEFTPDISKIEPVSLSSLIVTEDLTLLEEILGRGDTVTPFEVKRALMLLQTHITNYTYFFLNCSDPLWLGRLKNDYFQNPPDKIVLPDDTIQYPSWPELIYLQKICQHVPDNVIEIILQIPETDNPRVYDQLLEIALSLDGGQSVRLLPKILEYTSLIPYLIPHRFAELLAHWITENQPQAALDLADVLIQFHPDPQTEEKHRRKAENNQDDVTLTVDSMLVPAPRFDDWNYQQVMGKGVLPLTLKEPYKVARMLIDATANMIRLGKHPDELEEGLSHDSSETWCPKLEEQRRDYAETKETLVNTLTYACKEVFAQLSRELIASLDRVLRNQHWDVFKRIRQHLYTLYPNDQTKPWIRELILGYNDYAKGSRYPYEFQRMVKQACEHFDAALLTEDERTRFYDLILSGPQLEEYYDWDDEPFTEAENELWKREFHLLRLRPFASVLFGKFMTYYNELGDEVSGEVVTDDTYLTIRKFEGGFFTFRSPLSHEELSKLTDEELLTYINAWQNEQSDDDNWLVKINIPALAGAFKTLFITSIIPDAKRTNFWIEENRERIQRPIYVEHIVRALLEQVEGGNLDHLERWLEFCKWVLTHPDEVLESPIRYYDRLREDVSWRSSRRAVGDFVQMCLKEEVNVPISAREELASLLESLCTQYDWGLDRERSDLLTPDDPLTDAINTTRGRALENLIDFGIWVRRHKTKADVCEITSILEQRFHHDAVYSLTMPEHALLGRYFPHLYQLFKQWAVDHKSAFFPKDNKPGWLVGFGSFLIWNRPLKEMFEVICDDIEFALKHADELKQQNQPGRELLDVLGEHLFIYYAWDVITLKEDGSLLDRFYQTLSEDRQHWSTLFDFVGRSLSNTTTQQLDETLKVKILAFFEWRLEEKEPKELREFTYWLEAECLEANWRLNAYSRILDVPDVLNSTLGEPQYASLHTMALRKMIPAHVAGVVTCFEKLINATSKEGMGFISSDDAKAILRAGFEHEDENVNNSAKRSREALLRGGQLGFFDLED